jgi:UDP-N-acetylglucosamine diphosphorylase/glucosamine-1-phosphate N-acetyltransferase
MSDSPLVLLFDPPGRSHFFPLAYTRPLGHFLLGADTLVEKWQALLGKTVQACTPDAGLGNRFMRPARPGDWCIHALALPEPALVEAVLALEPGQALIRDGEVLAGRCAEERSDAWMPAPSDFAWQLSAPSGDYVMRRLWELCERNPCWLERDIVRIAAGGGYSAPGPGNTVLGRYGVFVAPDAQVTACVLDAREGPILIGPGAELMPGCLVRGPFALGEGAVLKMGTRVYGGCSIGPGCKVAGEISRSLMFAQSNKAHDGFLGHSVLGAWCNLGADTNNSNLRNNYGSVKLYNEALGRTEDTGLTFCGLYMGDHSKCGINTMFNTGTVVGVSANIYGAGFPPKFVPSFSWGGAEGWQTYDPQRALETAARVLARRNLKLDEEERTLLLDVFHRTAPQRVWDNPPSP